MFDDVVQIGQGPLQFPSVDGLGALARVLERDAEVGSARAGRFGGLDVRCCVADLCSKRYSQSLWINGAGGMLVWIDVFPVVVHDRLPTACEGRKELHVSQSRLKKICTYHLVGVVDGR